MRGDCRVSFASHFRVKAELYGMLLARSENAVDRAWYAGLVRSYTLLAASEDRHYHTGLKAVLAAAAPVDHAREGNPLGTKVAEAA